MSPRRFGDPKVWRGERIKPGVFSPQKCIEPRGKKEAHRAKIWLLFVRPGRTEKKSKEGPAGVAGR